jgi:hypothetical protein
MTIGFGTGEVQFQMPVRSNTANLLRRSIRGFESASGYALDLASSGQMSARVSPLTMW